MQKCTIICVLKANCVQFACVICSQCALFVCFGPMCSARERWLILPLRARKIRRHVVPTLWCWCRAFGWKEAATWDRPTVEIDLGVMFGLYDRMTASQRLQPVILWRCVTGLGQKRAVVDLERRPSTLGILRRRRTALDSWVSRPVRRGHYERIFP